MPVTKTAGGAVGKNFSFSDAGVSKGVMETFSGKGVKIDMPVEKCELKKLSADGRWCGKPPVRCVGWDCQKYSTEDNKSKGKDQTSKKGAKIKMKKEPVRNPRWEIKKYLENSDFYARLISANGVVLIDEGPFDKKWLAKRWIRTIKKIAFTAKVIDKTE